GYYYIVVLFVRQCKVQTRTDNAHTQTKDAQVRTFEVTTVGERVSSFLGVATLFTPLNGPITTGVDFPNFPCLKKQDDRQCISQVHIPVFALCSSCGLNFPKPSE